MQVSTLIPSTEGEQGNLPIRIPIPLEGALPRNGINLRPFFVCELHIRSSHILLKILNTPGPRNRDNIVTTSHQPRHRQLHGCASLAFRDSLKSTNQLQDLGEVLVRVPRQGRQEWVMSEVRMAPVPSGQKPTADRAVRNDSDAALATGLEQVDLGAFDVQGEGAVFDLQGGNGVDGVRSTRSSGRYFAEA